jgi:hypothetical protein
LNLAASVRIVGLTVGMKQVVNRQSGLVVLTAARIRQIMLLRFHALQLAQAFPKLFIAGVKTQQ